MLRNRVLIFLFIAFIVTAGHAQAQEQFVYDAKAKRNPFIPLISADGRILQLDKEERPSQDILIDGIIYDKFGRSYAIVNGEVASVGDRVGAYRVLKIEKDKVIFLNKDGQARVVVIYKEGE